jgi:CubicO group peptidase (beta-lactamase class C family)
MKKAVLLISILLLLAVGCSPDASGQYIYRPPENINDGLATGTLDEVNIDAELIEEAVNKIYSGQYEEVHSMLIFKDGKLALEEYFTGHQYQWDAPRHHGELVTWDRDMPHNVHSVTKSITSACIGIAVDEGFIESVHQPVFDYFPEHQHLKTEGKDTITVEHLLTMTSGLEWKEWSAPYSSTANPAIGIWFEQQNKDPVTYILEKPLVAEPGTSFNYSGGNMILLGEIIRNTTHMYIDEFSGNYLFEPLGIDYFDWWNRFENGVFEAASCLRITPRAMAKIGVTFLNNGDWNGEQIVSGQWVEKSATPFNANTGINVPGEASGRVGYSYTWWTKDYSISGKEIHMYTASGFGGQHIMVLPEVNTVVVFTCGNYLTKRPPFPILRKYLLPALVR